MPYRTSALIFLALLITGCGSDPGFNEVEDFAPREGAVEFVNMIPDSPELTIFHGISNERVGFPFTTGVQVRFVDDYDWRIAYLNTNRDEVTVAEADNQFITESTLSTFLMMGTTAQANIQIVDYPIIPLADRPAGMTEVWFASNVTNHSMLDIYVSNTDDALSDLSPTLSVTSGNFTELMSIEAGASKRLRVTEAGTQNLLFDSGEIDLPEQTRELFALVDDFNSDPTNHVDVIRSVSQTRSIMGDVSQNTEARVTNLTDLGPVTVNVADIQFSDVTRPDTTERQVIPTGAQVITVNQGETTAETRDVTVQAGSQTMMLIFSDADAETQPTTQSLFANELSRTVVDRVLFQFVNGSGVPVDFYALQDGNDTDDVIPTINDIQFATSGLFEGEPGSVRLAVTSSDGETQLATLNINLEIGTSYLAAIDTDNVLHVFTY